MAEIAKCEEKFSFSDIFETFHTTLKLKFRSKFAFFHRWCKPMRERKGFLKPSTPYNHSFAVKRFNPGKSLGNLKIKKTHIKIYWESYECKEKKWWEKYLNFMENRMNLNLFTSVGAMGEKNAIYCCHFHSSHLHVGVGSSPCLSRAPTGVPARGFFASRINMVKFCHSNEKPV